MKMILEKGSIDVGKEVFNIGKQMQEADTKADFLELLEKLRGLLFCCKNADKLISTEWRK